MRRLRVFTWHVHPGYLWYLAHLPHDFYIPVRSGRPFGYAGRDHSHPWPENVIEIPADKVKDLEFDCLLFQSEENWTADQFEILTEVQRDLPRIFFEHGSPVQSSTDSQHVVDDPNTLLIHVSSFNELMWNNGLTPTRVIEPGVSIPEGISSTYELERGLVTVDYLMNWERRLGADLYLRAKEIVPLDLIGEGWKEAGGIDAVPHTELPAFHSRYRFHFSPVRSGTPLLSTCEAMMLGQPVVAVATGELGVAIRDGVNGFVGTQIDVLIERMSELLCDPKLARKIGAEARRFALEHYDLSRFKNEWNHALSLVTGTTAFSRRRIAKTARPATSPKGRVALISTQAAPCLHIADVDADGQRVYVAHVARNLAKLGYEVDVFTQAREHDLPEIVKWESGVRIVNVDTGPCDDFDEENEFSRIPQFVDQMEKFCVSQRDPYDIVHANFWMSGFVASELKRRLGLPFVVTFHSLGRVRRHKLEVADSETERRSLLEQEIVEEADQIIAESAQDREDLLALYRADAERVSIIPCGFDPREMYPVDRRTARRHLGLDPDANLVLHVGRLARQKSFEMGVRGFAKLIQSGKVAAKLMIVGAEPEAFDTEGSSEAARLLKIAYEEGIADHVLFSDRKSREELKYYYSAADVFLTTPWYETFGITPLEAMACGTPVIGTRVGGLKSTIINGVSGFLVDPTDVEEVGNHLIQLMTDTGLRERMARKAFDRAHRHFRWDQATAQIARLYERTLRRYQVPFAEAKRHLQKGRAGSLAQK